MLNKKQHLNQYVINIQAVNNVDFKYVEFFLKPIWIQYIKVPLNFIRSYFFATDFTNFR